MSPLGRCSAPGLPRVSPTTCFSSYSTKDQEFADRIHADLQNKGVRCWFAPHDMPIGGKILDEIDSAIRLRDKLLPILSEHSIKSDWVEDEVTKAFEEERKRKYVRLFCGSQLVPPSRVARIVSSAPTAQPVCASAPPSGRRRRVSPGSSRPLRLSSRSVRQQNAHCGCLYRFLYRPISRKMADSSEVRPTHDCFLYYRLFGPYECRRRA
jgi:hypothetical protein